MAMNSEPIRWRVHLSSAPEKAYEFLSTDEGHACFWAESAVEREGNIDFRFPNGMTLTGRILTKEPPGRFSVEYFGGTTATFELASDGLGGTELTLTETGVPEKWREENLAGWVSVLMTLEAAVDHGIDLRNHDASRTWDRSFADN